MMEIVLSRRGGVPVRDQLVTQLELKILSGNLAPGQRLPSVGPGATPRHPSQHRLGGLRDLATSGHVLLRKGSGVFVRAGAPTAFPKQEAWTA
jgi:DNA-binding transcriptional regulator YhcF (GntR family)